MEAGATGIVTGWSEELVQGFRFILRQPLLIWIAVLSMVVNFAMQPLNVALPFLVKESRNLPPWFLGALECSIGIGSVGAALLVTRLCRLLAPDRVIAIGLAAIGFGIAVLAFLPDLALPLVAVLAIGAGVSLCNIPMMTQLTVAIPDHFRSRFTSVLQFLSQLAAPLGVMVTGALIGHVGIAKCLLFLGTLIVLPALLLRHIPGFISFYRMKSDEASAFLAAP
jgi:predicted MFS family arabinose efflux permease